MSSQSSSIKLYVQIRTFAAILFRRPDRKGGSGSGGVPLGFDNMIRSPNSVVHKAPACTESAHRLSDVLGFLLGSA